MKYIQIWNLRHATKHLKPLQKSYVDSEEFIQSNLTYPNREFALLYPNNNFGCQMTNSFTKVSHKFGTSEVIASLMFVFSFISRYKISLSVTSLDLLFI